MGRVCPAGCASKRCCSCSGGCFESFVLVDYLRLAAMVVTVAGWVTLIVSWVKGPSNPIGPPSNDTIPIPDINITTSIEQVPFLGSLVTTPAYVLLMLIFTCLRPKNMFVYVVFVLLLYCLSSLNIFFCGGIFGGLFDVEGRPEWLILAFFGSVVVAGCTFLVGATFLTKRPSRAKKYKRIIDEETVIAKTKDDKTTYSYS